MRILSQTMCINTQPLVTLMKDNPFDVRIVEHIAKTSNLPLCYDDFALQRPLECRLLLCKDFHSQKDANRLTDSLRRNIKIERERERER